MMHLRSTLSGPPVTFAGATYTLTLSAPTDPVADDLASLGNYLISWGDGTTTSVTRPDPLETITVDHVYTTADADTDLFIFVQLTDRDGVHTGTGYQKVRVNPFDLIVNDPGDVDDNDFTQLTLREAVRAANAIPGPNNISFDKSVTNITLAGTALSLTESINIAGPVTIDGGGQSRVFTMGGAVAQTYTLGELTLTGGAEAAADGGAILLNDADDILNVTDSIIRGNNAVNGGAISATGGATLNLTNTGLIGNTATTTGSGLQLNNSTALLTNVTVSGGLTASSAIENNGTSNLTLQNVTVAFDAGIGVNTTDTATTATVNSLLSDNAGANFVTAATATLTSNSGNVIDDGSLTNNGDLLNTNPLLAPLDATTATHALQAASTAIDAGIAYANIPGTDQRGIPFPRIVLGNTANAAAAPDAGAYEAATGRFATIPPNAILNILVDTSVDAVAADGLTSLREAVLFANDYVATSPVQISFAPELSGDTIGLVDGQLVVTHPDVSITGLGINELAVSGGGSSRVFQVVTNAGLSLTDITITGGYSSTDGGGIQNLGTLEIDRSVISGNQAIDFGGGIDSVGTLTITDTTVSHNIAGDGGGLFTQGSATISESTFAFNTATRSGGGIANGQDLTLTNVTVSGNVAADEGGGIGNQGTLSVFNSTVTNNIANSDNEDANSDDTGGGIDSRDPATGPAASLTIGNSIISGNIGPAGAENVTGTSTVDAFSLVGVDAGLAPLQFNGGPTATHALLAGSAAIDGGDPSFTAITTATDQRGFSRIVDRVDVGSVETVRVEFSEAMANESAGVIEFTVSLVGTIPDGESATVNFSTVPVAGGATANRDFIMVGQRQLVFTSQVTSQSVTTPIISDDRIEPNEMFVARLSDPLGVTVIDDQQMGTIIDDDGAGFIVTPSAGSTIVNEDSLTDTFEVVLTSQPESPVTLTVSPDQTAATVDRGQLTFDANNWDQPQTVFVSGVDDNAAGGDRQTTLTVSVEDNASDPSFDTVADETLNVTTIDGNGGTGDGLEVTSFVIDNPHAQQGRVNVTFTITNSDPTASAPTVVTFDHESLDAASRPSADVPAIAPGQAFTGTFEVVLDKAALFDVANTSNPFSTDPNAISQESQTLSVLLGGNDPVTAQFVYFPYDINSNGRVDGEDFIFIANRVGLPADVASNDARADFNGNGTVELQDFFAFANRFAYCTNTTVVPGTALGGSCAAAGQGEQVARGEQVSLDTDGNGRVTPADALMVINLTDGAIARGEGIEELLGNTDLDVNGNGFVTQVDAMLVIEAIENEQAALRTVENVGGVQATSAWQLADHNAIAIDQMFGDDEDDEIPADAYLLDDDLLDDLF